MSFRSGIRRRRFRDAFTYTDQDDYSWMPDHPITVEEELYWETLRWLKDQRAAEEAEVELTHEKLLSERGVLEYEMPPLLVDDLMVERTLIQIAAEYGVGKSFIALDLALSIAAGRPTFLDKKLHCQGPVLYLVGEGIGRFKLRVMAWKQHYRVPDPLPFFVWNGPIDLLDPVQVDVFITALEPLAPQLVVIDTLSRCIVGANENDTSVMTEAVAACDRIRTKLDTTVLIIHHMNKGGEMDRGSTVMPAALDTQFFLRRKTKRIKADDGETISAPVHGRIRLVHKKQKDLETGPEIDLVKEIITLPGQDTDGKPLTSCVWVTTEAVDEAALDTAILDTVRANKGIRLTTLAKKLTGRYEDNRAAIRALIDSGRLVDSRGLSLPTTEK